MMRGLSPSYLRFGGTSADHSVFTDADPDKVRATGTTPTVSTMSSKYHAYYAFKTWD